MESYNSQPHTQEIESIMSAVKKHYLNETRRALSEVYSSGVFGDYAREVDLFYVLRLVSIRTIASDLDELARVLKTFSTPQSYLDLAKLVFGGYEDAAMSTDEQGHIYIDLTLKPSSTDLDLMTETGIEAFETSDGTQLEGLKLSTDQHRNDYNYLCNYLCPPDINVVVNYY